MQKINQKYIKSIIQLSLREDLRPSGDITTRIIKNKKITAKIIAGQNCVVGGLNFAKEVFKISDKKITFKNKIKDGKKVNKLEKLIQNKSVKLKFIDGIAEALILNKNNKG